MGRLQDNQYARLQPRKKKPNEEKIKQEREKNEAKLISTFCPPLDHPLILSIWNDSHDYDEAFQTLTLLAKDADKALDEQQLLESMEQLDIEDSATTVSLTESEGENFNFLFNCFPTLPMEELVEALKSQGNDVEKATDVLLNRELIHQPDVPPKQVQKKKKKNNQHQIWSSGQLPTVSTSQGNTANSFAASMNMRKIMEREQENKNMADSELASVPFNFWHQYDTTVTNLLHYFPRVPKMNITACVQRCRGNVIASVKLLMERYPDQKPQHEFEWSQINTLTQVEAELKTIMEDRTPQDVKRVAIGVVIHEQNKTVEQLVQLGIEHFLTFDVSQLELEARLKKMAEESDMIRAKAKKREIPIIPEYLFINNQDTYQEDNAEECRDIAMQLILERNELFRKAAAAYRQAKNKGPGEGGVAFYYSDTARQIDLQARDWNLRAARATVRSHRLKHQDDHLLDLHGLTVAEAQMVLKEGITQWYSRSQMQSARNQFRPLKIITGAGKHSQYGESKLLPTTLKILKKEGWLYDMPHRGCIYVKGVKK